MASSKGYGRTLYQSAITAMAGSVNQREWSHLLYPA